MKNKGSKALLSMVLPFFFAAQAFAAEEAYVLDPTHTNIVWHADHFGFSTPSGKFATVEGTLKLDEAKPEASSVNVKITMSGIVTGIEKFDAHLKSADFFDVEKFPTATFVSTKVEPGEGQTAKVTGDLTFHGVSKSVVLNVKLNKIGEHPFSKKKTVGFSADTVVKRSEFGMAYAVPGVSDNVKIAIEAEASVQ